MRLRVSDNERRYLDCLAKVVVQPFEEQNIYTPKSILVTHDQTVQRPEANMVFCFTPETRPAFYANCREVRGWFVWSPSICLFRTCVLDWGQEQSLVRTAKVTSTKRLSIVRLPKLFGRASIQHTASIYIDFLCTASRRIPLCSQSASTHQHRRGLQPSYILIGAEKVMVIYIYMADNKNNETILEYIWVYGG